MANEHRIAQLLDEARYYEDHRMWLHAVQIYQRLIHDDPGEWKHRLRLGTIYLEMGNLPAAEQVLLQALRSDARNPEVLYALGLASYQGGDLDRALFYFQQLAGQRMPKAHYSLGLIHWRRAEYDHAERHFALALEFDPASTDYAVALGDTLVRNGKARDAVATLRRAVMQAPGDDLIEQSLAQALVVDGRHEEAVPLLEGLLRRHPDAREHLHSLAGVLIALRRFDDAESLLKRAGVEWPEDAKALVLLGRLYLLKANRDRAQQCFRRALDLDPDNDEALEQLRYLTPHGTPSP